MNCWVEIYQCNRLIYKDRFQLWTVEELPWEMKAKSRERQLKLKIERLLKHMPVFDPDQTKIFISFKSKMNNGQLPHIPEVQKREGVLEVE